MTGPQEPGVPILMYHSVSVRASKGFAPYAIHPSLFREHLDYIVDEEYVAVTVGELVSARRLGLSLPSRCVALTFDDAFTDFYSEVLPQLAARNLRATLFVPTEYVGSTAKWLVPCQEENRALLSWSCLADVATASIELAAHSRTHPEMDRLPLRDAVAETVGAKNDIQDHLGIPVRGFAYPFGYWSRPVRKAVEVAGFDYACQVAELTSTSADDDLAIPRHSVRSETTTASLALRLRSRASRGSRLTSDVKRIVCRATRIVKDDGIRADAAAL